MFRYPRGSPLDRAIHPQRSVTFLIVACVEEGGFNHWHCELRGKPATEMHEALSMMFCAKHFNRHIHVCYLYHSTLYVMVCNKSFKPKEKN